MIALLQRVLEASVAVDGARIASIGRGLLVFVAVEPGDSEVSARRLLDRILAYRVFDDTDGRLNLSVAETRGEVLLVSQFTLAADTRRGLRPGFTSAAPPELGRRLFECAVAHARDRLPGRVATGRFGAHMQVGLVNDGPVTFLLRISGTAETG